MLVPVKKENLSKVSGLLIVTRKSNEPDFTWVSRGADLDISGLPDKKALEIILWGFQKELFGTTHTDDGEQIRKKVRSSEGTAGSGKWVRVSDTMCWSTCAGSTCGEWICETTYSWTYVSEGGTGSDGGNGSGNDDCQTTSVTGECSEHPFGGGGGETITQNGIFYGNIDAKDLEDHPKAACIYSKLNNTDTFSNLIGSFTGQNTDFDLVIEVTKQDSGVLGTLNGSPGSNTFTMQLNSIELDRTAIEVAGTFLHEAIHAEMRQYLYEYEENNSIVLPGFPGDFAADWQTFVSVEYNGDPSKPEHETMAARYRDIIVNGLKEYGNTKLTESEYEAISWIGLRETDFFTQLKTEQERKAIDESIKSVKATANEKCN